MTTADSTKRYGGPSAKNYASIVQKTERSGLPESLTKRLVQEGHKKAAAGEPLTPELRVMLGQATPSLDGAGAQRNHVQAVENVNRFYAGVMAILTDHATSATERDEARRHGVEVARVLTGGDADVMREVEESLGEVDSDDESEDAAERASKLGRMTADHDHNIDIGHGGRNMGMSNRPDVMTSPRRTHLADDDADILDGLDGPFTAVLGPDLGRAMLEVPMSPGGTHISSSKTQEDPPPSSSTGGGGSSSSSGGSSSTGGGTV